MQTSLSRSLMWFHTQLCVTTFGYHSNSLLIRNSPSARGLFLLSMEFCCTDRVFIYLYIDSDCQIKHSVYLSQTLISLLKSFTMSLTHFWSVLEALITETSMWSVGRRQLSHTHLWKYSAHLWSQINSLWNLQFAFSCEMTLKWFQKKDISAHIEIFYNLWSAFLNNCCM